MCHSISEDTKTMTYQGQMSSSHNEYSLSQFEAQVLSVTLSFDVELFIVVMERR